MAQVQVVGKIFKTGGVGKHTVAVVLHKEIAEVADLKPGDYVSISSEGSGRVIVEALNLGKKNEEGHEANHAQAVRHHDGKSTLERRHGKHRV